MKKIVIAALSLGFLISPLQAEDKLELKTEKEKVSYGYGVNYAKFIKLHGLEIDLDVFARAVRDVLAGKEPLLTEQQMRDSLTAYAREAKTRQEEKNLKDGEAFLAANAKKPGVITLPSGLQYKILKEATGPMPKTTDSVTANFRGTLLDGSEFDSSYKRGQPATFGISGLIPAWKEALPKMAVGSKWELYVPAKLAYAERGAGGVIGPNATLIFEIELLSIKAPPANPPPSANPPPLPTPVTSDIIKVPSADEMKKGAKIEIIKPGSTNKVK
ncbi:MAG: FKBP-type peptidyl-prolyl cis-trans isomerase [Limisphaerales bacterium]